MIPDTLTQEQQHLKRILKNWARIEKPIDFLSRLIFFTLLGLLSVWHQKGRLGLSLALFALLGFSMVYLYCFVSRFAIRRFASKLTEEEKTLLRNAIIDTTIEDNQTIKNLLIASQKQGKSSNDLLRASQLPTDDTLLRPASQNENAPIQQLLRSAPQEEIERIHR